MDPRCHSRWHRCWHQEACGLTSPGILDSCTEFYLLWPSACRPVSIFTNLDTSQLLFPSALLNRIAGWCADLQSWMWLSPIPTYFMSGYCRCRGRWKRHQRKCRRRFLHQGGRSWRSKGHGDIRSCGQRGILMCQTMHQQKEGTTSGMAPRKVKAHHLLAVEAKEEKPRPKEDRSRWTI